VRAVSLRLRLVAAVLGLCGAAAAVITLAGVTELRGYLMGQADQLLGAEANSLARRPMIAWPWQGSGGPGRVCLEVVTPAGQPVMPTGCATGPAIPASPAWVLAHAGRPVTVPGLRGGQSWRVIAEPVHYRAHHIPYVYGASDYSLILTSRARPGFPATLVVGMGLAGVGHAVTGLAITGLSFSMIMLVAAAGIGAAAVRGSLRPLTQIRKTAEAAAEGGLPPGTGAGEPRGELGGLARSVNAILTRAGAAEHGQAAAEAAARDARERTRRHLLAALRELRQPLSVIAGFGEYYRRGAGPGAGDPGAMMSRVADETARMTGTVDALSEAADPAAAADQPTATPRPAFVRDRCDGDHHRK
jgi:two-component system OmpR family sensor kinase